MAAIMKVSIIVGLIGCAARLALAQSQIATGTFTGFVTRDSLGNRIAGATVELREIERTVRTDTAGTFSFSDLTSGSYLIIVRAIGYESLSAVIDFAVDKPVTAELSLTRLPVRLAAIQTAAARTSWQFEQFESRRRYYPTGTFLTDSLLRKRENSSMESILGMLPGARLIYDDQTTAVYLGSGRGSTAHGAFMSASTTCPVRVYIDGIDVSSADQVDVSRMQARDYSGVEFYSSASDAPSEYARTDSGCGVVLLWRRHRW